MSKKHKPEPCDIEIIERADIDTTGGYIIPNQIRINGHPVAAPADHPVVVHELRLSEDVVQVTLTLFARRVTIGHEQP